MQEKVGKEKKREFVEGAKGNCHIPFFSETELLPSIYLHKYATLDAIKSERAGKTQNGNQWKFEGSSGVAL